MLKKPDLQLIGRVFQRYRPNAGTVKAVAEMDTNGVAFLAKLIGVGFPILVAALKSTGASKRPGKIRDDLRQTKPSHGQERS